MAERWGVYLVRCADDSLYAGITNALDARIDAHNAGRGAKYTRSRLPVTLAWSKRVATSTIARRAEYAIKQLPRETKLLLAAGEERVWRRLRAGLREEG